MPSGPPSASWALPPFSASFAFAIAQPYAILDLPYYAADAYQQSEMVRRVIDFPYTRQYDDSLPFAYHIWQFSIWGVGLPLAILMWAGLGFTAIRVPSSIAPAPTSSS